MRQNSHVYICGALPFDTSTKRTPLAILGAMHLSSCHSRMIVLIFEQLPAGAGCIVLLPQNYTLSPCFHATPVMNPHMFPWMIHTPT